MGAAHDSLRPIARSLRLKLETSRDLCQSSPALAPLNDFAHGGYAGVRLGEARNQGPASHERDRAAEERNARQRRVNDAGDSVPGSQDALVRRVNSQPAVGGAAQGSADCRQNWSTAPDPTELGQRNSPPVQKVPRRGGQHGVVEGTEQREAP